MISFVLEPFVLVLADFLPALILYVSCSGYVALCFMLSLLPPTHGISASPTTLKSTKQQENIDERSTKLRAEADMMKTRAA